MAAVLACGSAAVLSHRSAATLWDLTSSTRSIHITVAGRAGRSRQGIAVHRGEALTPQDITTRDNIPCTTLSRTLLDLAAVVDRRTLERAIDRAELLRAFDLPAIESQIRRDRGRRGARALADAISDYSEPFFTRSQAEERMLELVAATGLPRPRANAWIALEGGSGYEADFLWESAKLIVEIDGRSYHARRRALRSDRQRDRTLALAGYETRRYEASELVDDPEHVATEVSAFVEGGSRTALR